MTEARHLTTEELHEGLDEIRRSPRDQGALVLIVRRPAIDEREVLERGELDLVRGWWATAGTGAAAAGASMAGRIPTCS